MEGRRTDDWIHSGSRLSFSVSLGHSGAHRVAIRCRRMVSRFATLKKELVSGIDPVPLHWLALYSYSAWMAATVRIAGPGDHGQDFPMIAAVDRSEEQRLNSSHSQISYAVFCLKKKKERFGSSHATHTGAFVDEPVNVSSDVRSMAL